MGKTQEVIRKTIRPASRRRKAKQRPKKVAILTPEELLEYKVRTIMFATLRDAYALWTRQVKAKYGIDQASVLEIDPGSGQLRVRKTVAEPVTSG